MSKHFGVKFQNPPRAKKNFCAADVTNAATKKSTKNFLFFSFKTRVIEKIIGFSWGGFFVRLRNYWAKKSWLTRVLLFS